MATNGMHAMLHDSNLPLMVFISLPNRMLMTVNDWIIPYEWFYWMKPDMGHMHFLVLCEYLIRV